jgi:hypothetical protein
LNKQDFTRLIKEPSTIQKQHVEEIEKLIKAFPYCQSAKILHLVGLKKTDSILYHQYLKSTAISVQDRNKLSKTIETLNKIDTELLNENKVESIVEEKAEIKNISLEKEKIKPETTEVLIAKENLVEEKIEEVAEIKNIPLEKEKTTIDLVESKKIEPEKTEVPVAKENIKAEAIEIAKEENLTPSTLPVEDKKTFLKNYLEELKKKKENSKPIIPNNKTNTNKSIADEILEKYNQSKIKKEIEEEKTPVIVTESIEKPVLNEIKTEKIINEDFVKEEIEVEEKINFKTPENISEASISEIEVEEKENTEVKNIEIEINQIEEIETENSIDEAETVELETVFEQEIDLSGKVGNQNKINDEETSKSIASKFTLNEEENIVEIDSNIDLKKKLNKNPSSFTSWLKKEVKKEVIEIKNINSEKQNILENFIKNQPRLEAKKSFYNPLNMAKKSVIEDPNFVSETLAEIYAKQGNIEKAIITYTTLSLKYPKKNTYFAEKIKELKKLTNP